jgi:hypothetical protein
MIDSVATMASMIIVFIIRSFAGQFAFSPIMGLINNSVEPTHMGAANGLGM